MSIKEGIINQYDFNLVFAKKLVEDLSEEQMTQSPAKGLENHPAFTLGHLITGTAMTVEDLGGKMDIPQGWEELFLRKGPGDPRLPIKDPSLYPRKNELIKELEKQHERLKSHFLSIEDSKLNEKISWRFSSYMPTLWDLVIFMCINHEAMHLGQLSAWRRAMDLPSALGQVT